MPESVTGEVRLTDPDLAVVLARIAHEIEYVERPVVARFAAEGSAYPVTFVPFESMAAARPEARWPIASEIGIGPGSVYVVRQAHREGRAAWISQPAYFDIQWVMEWLCPNPVDAVSFCVFLNLVHFARRPDDPDSVLPGGPEKLIELAEGWLERLGRATSDDDPFRPLPKGGPNLKVVK